jgi:hypothetical protein
MQLDSITAQQAKLKLLIEEAKNNHFQEWEDIDLELDSIFYWDLH